MESVLPKTNNPAELFDAHLKKLTSYLYSGLFSHIE